MYLLFSWETFKDLLDLKLHERIYLPCGEEMLNGYTYLGISSSKTEKLLRFPFYFQSRIDLIIELATEASSGFTDIICYMNCLVGHCGCESNIHLRIQHYCRIFYIFPCNERTVYISIFKHLILLMFCHILPSKWQ